MVLLLQIYQCLLYDSIISEAGHGVNRDAAPLMERVYSALRKRFLGLTGLTAGRFLSLTALRAEGCGIALSGDEYKVSVTGLAVCVICDTISSATYFLVSP